nr:hypothetical protein [uncultured Pseudodesulfovibrio sp.]
MVYNMVNFIPAQWASGGLPEGDLVHTFISEIEKSVERMASDFENSEMDETHEIEEPYDNCDSVSRCWLTRSHKGISDGCYCLDEIFLDYYPTLHRSSALLTIYGLMEKQLQYVVNKLEEYSGIKYKRDRQLSIVGSCMKYLEDEFNCSPEKKESLNYIRLVRNLLAHNAGQLEEQDEGKSSKLLEYIENKDELEIKWDELMIRKGYLSFVMSEFDEYFCLISSAIKKFDQDRGVSL